MTIKNLDKESLARLLKNTNKVRCSAILAVPDWCVIEVDTYSLLEKLDTFFKNKISFYTMAVGLEDEFTIKYGLRNVPTLFVFDSKNTLVAQTFGNDDFNFLAKVIEPFV